MIKRVCLLLLLAVCIISPSFAGGGPENVMLVVNRRSGSSLAIANHYQQLRHIPDSNILHLDWDGNINVTSIETFRDRILTPILAAIDKRKLSSQIDYIVYSSDFPYAINFGDEVSSDRPGKYTKGSITGLTYLAPLVMAKTSYSGGTMNWYMRVVSPAGLQSQPTRGFRFEHFWNKRGDTVEQDGMRYILSTMLGYTSGRGNSLEEVFDYLEKSAAADSTQPQGTIYFCQNEDVRSTVRQPWFPAAAAELSRLGVRAEILDGKEGVTPRNRDDVQGVALGRSRFNWGAAKNEILPGAICENFTSFGGKLAEDARQTPLTDLLRYGAAGSSGTVVEPFANTAKFPNPFVQVHYARGCSLAEAFYQSVHGPYQQLVVGDPLCQPWAKPPRVQVEGIRPGQTVQGALSIQVRIVGDVPAKYCDVFLEGRRVARIAPNAAYELDTTLLPDGYHEFRVVAVAADRIEAQGRQIVDFSSLNHDREITFTIKPQRQVLWNQPLQIDAESPGALGIAVYANRQLIARAAGAKNRIVVKPLKLGLGHSRLKIVGLFDKRPAENVFSVADIEVVAPPLLPALPTPVGLGYEEGLKLSTVLATSTIKSTVERGWAKAAGLTAGDQFSLEGLVEVPQDGLYQLQAVLHGEAKLFVDDGPIAVLQNQTSKHNYALLPLQRGWHAIKAEAKLGSSLRFELRFGGAGCRSLAAPAFHVPP